MMRTAASNTPERPITIGSRIAGYRIEKIVERRAGCYTLVEGVAADGGRVALKVIDREIGENKEFTRRVVELARLRASIRHQSLLPLRRAGQQGRWLFVANPVARGLTLAERLEDGPLSPEDALALLRQVAAGLDAAAVRGLIHRELEPANIFLTSALPPHALLSDFGVAIPDGRACDVPSTVRAASYTPPEVVRGQARVAESNVYSLGCILVEALTGVRPFERDRALLTLHAQLVEPPPRPSELKPELPAALDDVIAIALAKDPAKRFATASHLMSAAGQAFAAGVAPAPAPTTQRAHSPTTQRAHSPEPRRARPRLPSKPTAARGDRPGRRIRIRIPRLRTVPALSLALLVLATTSGFALGSVNRPDSPAPPVHTTKPRPAVSHASLLRARDAQTVNTVLSRLVVQRDVALRGLHRAGRAATQAAEALRLAQVYRAALSDLPAPSRSHLDLSQVRLALQANLNAYQGLAAAAAAADAASYRAAGRAIKSHELELQHAVRALRRPAASANRSPDA